MLIHPFQPKGKEPGIYFNMSNEDYHNDPALSHSGMTHILVSWPDYWTTSTMNPERAPWKQTEAMAFGERSAMLLLQPKLFHATYNTLGKSVHNVKAMYLSSMEWRRISESVDDILEIPTGRQHFSNGYAEVSIFWRDPGTGIMLRMRADYLHTFGAIDVKRIKEVNNKAIGRAVMNQGLDIQAFLYLEGIKAARKMLKNMGDMGIHDLAKAEGVDPVWLRELRDDDDLIFRFMFQRSTPPFIWQFRDLENDVMTEGANAVFEAIRRYDKGLRKYGTKKPPRGYDTLKTISSYHVPRRDYDYDED